MWFAAHYRFGNPSAPVRRGCAGAGWEQRALWGNSSQSCCHMGIHCLHTDGCRIGRLCLTECAMGVCKAQPAVTKRRWALLAPATSLNLSWVLFWACFMTVLLFSTDVKWWSREIFRCLSFCLGLSCRSQGDGWTWMGADGRSQTWGGCTKRYGRSAAAAAAPVFVLFSGFLYCEDRTSGGLYLCICAKHTLRRSDEKQWLCRGHEVWEAVGLGVKLCTWL